MWSTGVTPAFRGCHIFHTLQPHLLLPRLHRQQPYNFHDAIMPHIFREGWVPSVHAAARPVGDDVWVWVCEVGKLRLALLKHALNLLWVILQGTERDGVSGWSWADPRARNVCCENYGHLTKLLNCSNSPLIFSACSGLDGRMRVSRD
jgi:hypothetical protein